MGVAEPLHSDDVVERIIEGLEVTLRQRASYPNWLSDNEFEQLCRDVVRLHGPREPKNKPALDVSRPNATPGAGPIEPAKRKTAGAPAPFERA
jgi:hypothetical protein